MVDTASNLGGKRCIWRLCIPLFFYKNVKDKQNCREPCFYSRERK